MLSGSIFIVPNGTFVFELVLFIIVLGVFAKFILPPIDKVMDERNALISDAARQSDEGRAEAEKLARDATEALERARSDARALLEEANAQAERARDDARQRGQAEHGRIVADAQATIAAEQLAMRDELIDGLDVLVVAAAERVIGARVDADRHAAVIERAREAARAAVT